MSKTVEVNENMSADDLDEVVDILTFQEINYLFLKKQAPHLPKLTEKISSQIPDIITLIQDLTERQYFEQEIEVYAGLKVKLRTNHPSAHDEAFQYALKKSGGEDPSFSRTFAMKKLSYAICEINGSRIGNPHPTESYAAIALKDSSFTSTLLKDAESRMQVLELNPLSEKIKEVFLIWSQEISKIIQDPEGGAVDAIKK
jgi:hypothetical protein